MPPTLLDVLMIDQLLGEVLALQEKALEAGRTVKEFSELLIELTEEQDEQSARPEEAPRMCPTTQLDERGEVGRTNPGDPSPPAKSR
jgi:hypothetical protein